jgi:predicted deacylase
MIAEALRRIDASELSGTVVAIPVANPVAFANRTRNTPEKDSDIANLNRVFPGGVGAQEHGKVRIASDRGLTERMADTIYNEFLPHINYLIDFHHTQEPRVNREAMFKEASNGVGEESFAMARALGMGILQQTESGQHPGSLSGVAAEHNIPSTVAEVGGGFLPKAVEDRSVAWGVRGILNVARHCKMLPGEIEIPKRQVVVSRRATVRPSVSGYFIADLEAEDLIGADEEIVEVKQGQRLGVLLDPYTLEETEELTAASDGFPVVIRRTGLCEAGDRGIAIGMKEFSRWIE